MSLSYLQLMARPSVRDDFILVTQDDFQVCGALNHGVQLGDHGYVGAGEIIG